MRNAISEPSDHARPSSRELAVNSASPTMNNRRRPNRSASRPPSSNTPPKTIEYAVITHCRLTCEKCRSVLIEGSATFTIATSRTTMNWATTISASTIQRRRSWSAVVASRIVSVAISGSFQIVDRRHDSTRIRSARYTVAGDDSASHDRRAGTRRSSRSRKSSRPSSGYLLARLGLAFKEQALASAEASGFELYDYSVLAILSEGARETQATIADALDLDPSRLVALLDSLQQRDLVVRQRDPNDRRRHVVSITTAGLARARADARDRQQGRGRLLRAAR